MPMKSPVSCPPTEQLSRPTHLFSHLAAGGYKNRTLTASEQATVPSVPVLGRWSGGGGGGTVQP